MSLSKYKISPLPDDSESILILAGDLSEGWHPRSFIERESKNFKIVLYVLGNHEFYNRIYHEVIAYWKQREKEIDNFFLLHDEVFEHDNVRFLGTTLWTDLNNGDFFVMEKVKKIMNDFRYIRYLDKDCLDRNKYTGKLNGRTLLPSDTLVFHKKAVDFLESELSKEYDGTTVVVSHHSPSTALVADMYRDSLITSAFHANCDKLFNNYQIDYWFYGHTHYAIDTMLGDTRVCCNPRGYVGYENQKEIGFNDEFQIDLIRR